MIAAVNFQLRFSPGMLALRDLPAPESLGALVDIDVRIVIDQPWHLWPFLERAPRLEVLYHSIHYLDAIRWIAGEPRRRVLPRASASRRCRSSATRAARSSSTTATGSAARWCSTTRTGRPDAPGVAADGRGHDRRGAADAGASTSTIRPARPTRWRSPTDGEWRHVAAARLVVHRGVRGTDVEPAALRRRRRSRRWWRRSTTRSRRWRSSRRATSRASAAATPIPRVD